METIETYEETTENQVQHAARINTVLLAHGVQPLVGFTWRDTFIHDPFADPQYGAFTVDPITQYGDDYVRSIFVTDPIAALDRAGATAGSICGRCRA